MPASGPCHPSPGSLLDLPEGIPETLGFVGRRSEILVVHGGSQRLQVGVDTGEIGVLESIGEPVPNPFEGGEIPSDPGHIVGRRVGEHPARPDVEAREVGLGGGLITELEVKAGDGGVVGCLAHLRRISGIDCSGECL